MQTPGPDLPLAAAWLREGTVTPNHRWQKLCGDPGDVGWRRWEAGGGLSPLGPLLLEQGNPPSVALYAHSESGTVVQVQMERAGPDEAVLAVAHDVSAWSAALHDSRLDLLRERLRRALGAFHLERALHDLNNHFHAIELRVSFLRASRSWSEDDSKLLHEVEQSGMNAHRGIEGLRNPDAASPARASQAAELSDVVALAGALARRDGGKVTLRPELATLPAVTGTADDLAIVFALLFDNAREADGALHVGGAVRPGQVVVTLTDDGPGIPAEVLPKVCKPFFTTKGESHSGLGLALALKLLHASDAQLQVANREDARGTRVTLTLRPAPVG